MGTAGSHHGFVIMQARVCRSPVPVQASETDKADRDTDDVQGRRETPGCFQSGKMRSSLRLSHIAPDNSVFAVLVHCPKPLSEPSCGHQYTNDHETSKTYERKNQHRKYAEERDRQERNEKQYLGCLTHRSDPEKCGRAHHLCIAQGPRQRKKNRPSCQPPRRDSGYSLSWDRQNYAGNDYA